MSPLTWLGRLRAQTPTERTARAIEAAQKGAYLQSIDILRDLDPAGMDELVRGTRMTTARRGQVIYTQAERPEALFLLTQGHVQLYRLSPQGKKLALALLEAGPFLGRCR